MTPGLISLGYLALLWIWVASASWQEWVGNPDYNHGLLVLPLAAYFAAKRLRALPPTAPGKGRPIALVALFLPVFLGLPLELLNLSPLHWRLVAWAVFAAAAVGSLGLVYLVGGWAWLRASWFPLLFAATAIPWPTVAEQSAGAQLLPWLAETTGDLLRLGGIPTQRQGSLLILPNCVVGIEQACSGLRSLQAALMVSLAAGEFAGLSLLRRGILLALVPVVALGFNLGRTLVLSLAGFHGGNEAIHAWHDASGFGAMVATAFVLLGIAGLLRPRSVSVEVPAPKLAFTLSRIPVLAPVLFLAALSGAHGWYAWHAWNQIDRQPEWALRNPTGDALPLPADLAAILHPDFGGYFREQVPNFGPLTGYHFFWKSSRKTVDQLYHRPDVCMPGAGWKMIAPPVPFTVSINERPTQWHLLEYEREGIRATMLWGGWLNGEAVEFSLGLSSSLQTQIMAQLIQAGTRNVCYEVAGVLVPYTGEPLPTTTAAAIVKELFTLNENPSRR